MGKAKKSRSPSPIVGYRRTRSRSFKAVAAKAPAAGDCRRTSLTSQKGLTIKDIEKTKTILHTLLIMKVYLVIIAHVHTLKMNHTCPWLESRATYMTWKTQATVTKNYWAV